MMGNQFQALQREKGRVIARRMIVKKRNDCSEKGMIIKLMRDENKPLRLLRELNRPN